MTPPITVLRRPGRRAHNLGQFVPKNFAAPDGDCVRCGKKLAVSQHRARQLQLLNEKWLLEARDARCPDPDCLDRGLIYRPVEELRVSMPKCGYGLEVILFIVESHLKRQSSLPRIHSDLQARGIQISQSHVGNLFRLGLSVVHCQNEAALRVRLQKQEALVLAIDAVCFGEGAAPLYVVRDVISGEFLASGRPDLRGQEQLVAILARAKELGVPVRGVISDKEAAIIRAVSEAFPDVPHQFCQLHYLQNLATPSAEESSRLTRGVNSAVRAVRELEKSVLKISTAPSDSAEELARSKEKETVLKLSKVVSSIGRTRGDNLLDPTPLRRFQRLEKVSVIVDKARSKSGEWPLLAKFAAALALVTSYLKHAVLLTKQVEVLRRVAHLMASPQGSQVGLKNYVLSLPQLLPSGIETSDWERFTAHVIRTTDRWSQGLFEYLKVPGLPATNNDLERLFGSIKGFVRRVTGRSSTSGGPLETCAEFFVEAFTVLRMCTDVEISQMFAGEELSREQLEKAVSEFEALAEPARYRRSVARSLEPALEEIFEDWMDDS
jgi:hypothetical protein